MHSYLAAFVAGFPLLATAQSLFDARSTNYTAIFASGLSSGASIHFPNQPDYNTSIVQRYSTWDQPDFFVTIKPATDQDVQYVIKTANRYNIPFLATGGGHGSEPGFAKVKNAVNIDLSNFREKKIDTKANRLTIGPGMAFFEFEKDLYDVGKHIPVGNAYCVNMIGATIGAAHGPYQGMHGLGIDALRSVRLVTASGDIVTASDTQNKDLFWAVRGAGANFGIITSATYEIYDAPNGGNLVEADFAYNGSVNAALWQLLESWDETYPREMGLTMVASFNRAANATSLSASMSFFGTKEQAQPWVDQFVAIGPTRWQSQTIPWWNASQAQGFGTGSNSCRKGVYNNHPSVGTKQTNAETYTKVVQQHWDFAASRPWFNGIMFLQRFNTTATLAVPKDKQGVYPGREFGSLIVFQNFYDGPAHDTEVYNYQNPLRAQLAATSGFGKLRTYINYAYGDEGPEVWYGKENLPKLSQLKRKWDPLNKFGAGNPIPLNYS
ncbi:FAD-binding domain-containing protein [Delitschia confertaspora ATCC 74209]|uniref:FAD-binding domain-containing protein n=1 Tax=Delitschia confertaspora ATCC 74209 TaxID=1513339 RepID=A0A9P4MWA8_9PLEO|nr:FAD-binding domain-containing protein [Delitschia confertaspora ATCC 74209]